MIVDDDTRNIFALQSYLEQSGILVETAASGAEAIRLLNGESKIEMVLMDMMMPEMDGFEAIEIIRETPVLNKIPILSVTAKAMVGDREKCLKAGATEYVSKPIIMKELFEKMARCLHDK